MESSSSIDEVNGEDFQQGSNQNHLSSFLTLQSLQEEASILEERELGDMGLCDAVCMDENGYARLFTIYLILQEMCSAKFLWKRIPAQMKSSEEMKRLWGVGEQMWKKDYKATFSAIRGFQWSSSLQIYITTLEKVTMKRSIDLAQKAYNVINFSTFCDLTGTDPEKGSQLIQELGWTLDTAHNTVTPTRPVRDGSLKIQFDDELQKLTQIICAIESF